MEWIVMNKNEDMWTKSWNDKWLIIQNKMDLEYDSQQISLLLLTSLVEYVSSSLIEWWEWWLE